ncbi:metallophosphoesterase [Dysgonomonas sp. BGC7]|uniref:metallophosphoesterase n=1 Tax=Dysgonomonas sp. BGC7 TaxID=1658008 RepID=UPI000680D446|nr:metallophosphoesterase [Dysgonomonas sp. BGC7]MBD8389789.1 metallophosphoesterase [Dysgonomonas sp. BGC7]
MKNIIIILLFTFTLLNSSTAQTASEKPILKFGLIADPQYGDCETKGSRFYRNSLDKLRDAVEDINQTGVSFTINLGDFTDRSPADLDAVLSELDKLNSNIYNTTGNHDYASVDNNQLLYDRLSMPSDYYSIDLPRLKYRFIFLNSNELSTYSNVTDTAKLTELTVIKNKLKTEGRKNNQNWNGAFSNEQLMWLEEQLKTAGSSNTKVIICLHHTIFPENNHNLLNNLETLEIMSKYKCIKVVLSGHNHFGNFGYYSGIPFITIEGMIETEKENAYAIVEVYNDTIKIKGRGRVPSREINF